MKVADLWRSCISTRTLPNKSLMNDYFFLFSSIIVTLILTQDYFSAGLFYQIIWIRIILVQLFFLQDYFSTRLFYLQDYLIYAGLFYQIIYSGLF